MASKGPTVAPDGRPVQFRKNYNVNSVTDNGVHLLLDNDACTCCLQAQPSKTDSTLLHPLLSLSPPVYDDPRAWLRCYCGQPMVDWGPAVDHDKRLLLSITTRGCCESQLTLCAYNSLICAPPICSIWLVSFWPQYSCWLCMDSLNVICFSHWTFSDINSLGLWSIACQLVLIPQLVQILTGIRKYSPNLLVILLYWTQYFCSQPQYFSIGSICQY
jgi:hypothetical protein